MSLSSVDQSILRQILAQLGEAIAKYQVNGRLPPNDNIGPGLLI